MPSPIEDYALIGDCETAALVSRNGSIDWLCLPRFDSDACFAALLGTAENGYWRIAPVDKFRVRRRYRPKTLILETEFETETGTATLIDFMPLRKGHPEVVRLVRCDRGSLSMRMDLAMRFDYGRTVPWVTRQRDGSLVGFAGPHLLVIRTNIPLRGQDLTTVGEFRLAAGDTANFELTYGSSFERVPSASDLQKSLEETEQRWRKWISRCKYAGPHAELLERSLITLKALTYQPTGGIVAAPTTSLPEQPGGQRNWDYRFCWLRDAYFVVKALNRIGATQTMEDFISFILGIASEEVVRPVYSIVPTDGMEEEIADNLKGYRGDGPVRIGNAAGGMLQHDTYGSIILAAMPMFFDRRLPRPADAGLFHLLERVGALCKRSAFDPDAGLWEYRGRMRVHTHSASMCWAGCNRLAAIGKHLGLKERAAEWKAMADSIQSRLLEEAWNEKRGAFTAAFGADELDASVLLLPEIGLVEVWDPRFVRTVQAIEHELLRGKHVMRYAGEDDFGLPESAFLICRFWLIDAWWKLDRREEAVDMFNDALRYRNRYGLLAEDVHLQSGEMCGNFPQTYSMAGLILTAMRLSRSWEDRYWHD